VNIDDMTVALVAAIAELHDDEARITALNTVRTALHSVSPLRSHPVDLILWVKSDDVVANDYNPNDIAPPEMKLLEHSIMEDGYTQPVVTWLEDDRRETIDGYHRGLVGRTSETVRARTLGYLPVVTANAGRLDRGDRIAATIRHNRARGTHQVGAMSEVVLELARRNWSDVRIAKELGMGPDEVLRLKQVTGLAALFADREFSEAWEPADDSLSPSFRQQR
jgi:ParB-like chromosome segregation protein Spo0J